MPLSDLKCRSAKKQPRSQKLSDGGGLHLLVNADGSKYWRLAYRWQSKQRTLALGVYPTVSLTDARVAREEAKRNLRVRHRSITGQEGAEASRKDCK